MQFPAVHNHHFAVVTRQVIGSAGHRHTSRKQPHLQLAQVLFAASSSARSSSVRSKRKMTISMLFLALLIPLTKGSIPSPGCINSFTRAPLIHFHVGISL